MQGFKASFRQGEPDACGCGGRKVARWEIKTFYFLHSICLANQHALIAAPCLTETFKQTLLCENVTNFDFTTSPYLINLHRKALTHYCQKYPKLICIS